MQTSGSCEKRSRELTAYFSFFFHRQFTCFAKWEECCWKLRHINTSLDFMHFVRKQEVMVKWLHSYFPDMRTRFWYWAILQSDKHFISAWNALIFIFCYKEYLSMCDKIFQKLQCPESLWNITRTFRRAQLAYPVSPLKNRESVTEIDIIKTVDENDCKMMIVMIIIIVIIITVVIIIIVLINSRDNNSNVQTSTRNRLGNTLK